MTVVSGLEDDGDDDLEDDGGEDGDDDGCDDVNEDENGYDAWAAWEGKRH